MFELYTEKARRVIFFARYEASQYGSPTIETEHLLLGLVRENRRFGRFQLSADTAQSIRSEIGARAPSNKPIPTTIDLPLTHASRQVLIYAKEEAEQLHDKHIGAEHLLLGLLHDEGHVAAQILKQHGADISQLRLGLVEEPQEYAPPVNSTFVSRQGFRPAKDTISIHGIAWNTEYILDAVTKCRQYSWFWRKTTWVPRDMVVQRSNGAISFDLTLAADAEHFSLIKGGWKKDHCAICHWEMFESQDNPRHGVGYTNGLSWLCTECYEKFLSGPNFFSSTYNEMT